MNSHVSKEDTDLLQDIDYVLDHPTHEYSPDGTETLRWDWWAKDMLAVFNKYYDQRIKEYRQYTRERHDAWSIGLLQGLYDTTTDTATKSIITIILEELRRDDNVSTDVQPNYLSKLIPLPPNKPADPEIQAAVSDIFWNKPSSEQSVGKDVCKYCLFCEKNPDIHNICHQCNYIRSAMQNAETNTAVEQSENDEKAHDYYEEEKRKAVNEAEEIARASAATDTCVELRDMATESGGVLTALQLNQAAGIQRKKWEKLTAQKGDKPNE